MNTLVRTLGWTAVALLVSFPASAVPLGTGFTYQGQLTEGGSPVTGTRTLRFSLWDDQGSGSPPVGGSQIGGSQVVTLTVTNGQFTALLDDSGQFGVTAFNGDARWLQVEVCADTACGTSTVLAPRQPVTATPYSRFSAAPWQSNGADLYFLRGLTAKVGIGTSSPAAKLDVFGNAPITFRAVNFASGADGVNASVAGVFRADGPTPDNTAGSFVSTGPTRNTAGFFSAIGGTSNYAIWSEEGINHFRRQVGIGTPTPNNTLSVNGDSDFSGRVGIGVTAPASALSIRGEGFTSSSSGLNVADAAGTSTLFVRDDRRIGIGTTDPFHLVQIGGGFDGHLGFGPSDASPNAGYIRFGDNTGWKLHLGRAREFSAGPINTTVTGAIMTLVDQGNVGIGTINPSQRLHVVGNICATGSISTCSDLRFKEQITPLHEALSDVLSLQGVSFSWRANEYPGLSRDRQIGLIAQDVEKVRPELVQTGSDGYKSVDYARLTPVLIEAIKELNAKNEMLQGQLTALADVLKSLAAERQDIRQESEPGR